MDYNLKNKVELIKRKKDDAMRIFQKLILLLAMMATSTFIFAQDKDAQMADTMRSNGRIYVVVAVVLTILIGLLLYIVRLDKKITNLERSN